MTGWYVQHQRCQQTHSGFSQWQSGEVSEMFSASTHPALIWASPRPSNFPPQAHSKGTNLNLWRINLVETSPSIPGSSDYRLANRGGQTSAAFAPGNGQWLDQESVKAYKDICNPQNPCIPRKIPWGCGRGGLGRILGKHSSLRGC